MKSLNPKNNFRTRISNAQQSISERYMPETVERIERKYILAERRGPDWRRGHTDPSIQARRIQKSKTHSALSQNERDIRTREPISILYELSKLAFEIRQRFHLHFIRSGFSPNFGGLTSAPPSLCSCFRWMKPSWVCHCDNGKTKQFSGKGLIS